MSAPFSLMYLEDELRDASAFAKIIQEAFAERGEEKTARLENAEEAAIYLREKGIDWIESYEQFQSCLEQLDKYRLFLIDMKVAGETGVRGWEAIEKIREKRGNQASPIWILSNYSFYERLAKRDYQIQHFFSKNPEGYERLKGALAELFLPAVTAGQSEYLEFKDSQERSVQIPVSEIVSVEIENRQHYLYQLDPDGIFSHKKGFPPHKIFHIAQKQIAEKKIRDLVQISHGVIINVKLVERIEGSGKNYRVYLCQRGDNRPLKVSYSYLKNLKESYGDPLPLL